MRRNEEEGIYNILLETEPVIAQLNKKRRVKKAGLGRPILTSLGRIAAQTKALEMHDHSITSKATIHILYRTRKKTVIQIKPNKE